MNEKQNNTSPALLNFLQQALQNLQEFTKIDEQTDTSSLSIYELKEATAKNSLLDKTKQFVQRIFGGGRQKIKQNLLQSIEILQKHSSLIAKMQQGTQEERKWSMWAQDIIYSFNNMMDRAKTSNPLEQRVSRFVYRNSRFPINEYLVHHKIVIPTDPSFYFCSSRTLPEEPASDATSKKIVSFLDLSSSSSAPLTKQETDIFYMKTISLSNSSELPKSLRNALKKMIWDTPIHTIVANASQTEQTSTLSLVQTLAPFPGEVIKVRGAFLRDHGSIVSSVPIKDSFQLTTSCSQSGFPHPSQHTGWTLSQSLIPDHSDHPLETPFLEQLLRKKEAVARMLLPNGALNQKAKQILQRKKEIFLESHEIHLEQHEQLSLALLEHSPAGSTENKTARECIRNFYSSLADSGLAYKHLSQAHCLFNQLLFTEPMLHVHNHWLKHPGYRDLEPKLRQQRCVQLVEEKTEEVLSNIKGQLEDASNDFEKAILQYILTMGAILKQSGQMLLLQFFSAQIGFAPPLFRNFEIALQTLLYRQLYLFHQDLESLEAVPPDIHTSHIQCEISILHNHPPEDPATEYARAVVGELEVYYNALFFRTPAHSFR